MPEIPTNEPLELRAGDTWKWKRTDQVADYPSPTWTLTYRFKNKDGGFEIVATADGSSGFSVSVPKATTAAIAAGTYAWQAEVDNGTERYTLERGGVLKVIADFFAGTAAAALDQRSHERKLLEQVQAAMLALNTGVKSYAIGTRQMTFRDMPELIAEESRLKWLVANEEARAKIADGRPNPRDIRIRFGSP